MSVNSTDPSTLFGGTWQRIQGRFLLAAGGGYNAGSTGGEAEHTLTAAEAPNHSHSFGYHSGSTNSGKYIASQIGLGTYGSRDGYAQTENNTGGGQPHNNMPPYLAVYVWKRTA